MAPQREPLPTSAAATPDLPAAFDDALEAGLADLGIALEPAARVAIETHVRLLLAWTTAINLTAIRDPAGVAVAHVVDSLTAVTWLGARGPVSILDLGSGGGFPGVPLAVALPATRVGLLEATGKKARFLETVVGATGLGRRVGVIPGRAEELARDGTQQAAWSIVTARAVGGLAELIELAFPLLELGGSLMAWKRGALDGPLGEELRVARRALGALGGGDLDVIDVPVRALAGHRLVIATRAGRVPEMYPRDPATRRRSSW
jgi:16S rRNA (guanine527-N7)-methyltransferase